MEMKNFIEQAERKAGKQVELAKTLGVTAGYLRAVKAGKKGFSTDMCIVLADYIGADRLEVIAASNLVTEKDERKRKIFESCFSTAASLTITAVFVALITIMTPSPANASPVTTPVATQFVLC